MKVRIEKKRTNFDSTAERWEKRERGSSSRHTRKPARYLRTILLSSFFCLIFESEIQIHLAAVIEVNNAIEEEGKRPSEKGCKSKE